MKVNRENVSNHLILNQNAPFASQEIRFGERIL